MSETTTAELVPAFTPEEFARLPKYAQHRIVKLENDLAAAHRRLAIGPEESRVFLDPHNRTPRPLGESPKLRFYPHGKAGPYIDVEMLYESGVVLRTSSVLLVSPTHSNRLEVRSAEHAALDHLDRDAGERARRAEPE